MSNNKNNLFRFSFAFIDLLALNFVHVCLMVFYDRIPENSEKQYLYLFLAANIFWLLSSYLTALYVDDVSPNVDKFAKRTIKSFITFNVLMLFFLFASHYPYSRSFMIISFVAYFLFLVFTRMMVVGFYFYIQKANHTTRNAVILGYNEVAKSLVERLATQRKNLHVSGYFEDEEMVKELTLKPVIGRIDECLEYAKTHNIQEIYSTISPERSEHLYEMALTAEKSLIRFKFVPDLKMYLNRNTHVEYLAEIPILSLRPEPLEDIGNATRKRIFDIIFSVFAIVFVLTWLIPIIGILIKLSSKGPVFFVQMRSGKNNKEFRCFKFRTLRVNNDAHSKQVTKDDARITKIGRFMRKTNVDELPQFLNVLMGDMSIVGPRPHMLKHTTMFSKIMEEYMIRHFVKPGVTGWAQVNGFRGEIKENEQLRNRIRHDIWYMENWSLWLDFKIIWLTVYSTIKGDKNAY